MSEKRMNRYWGDQSPPKRKDEFFNAVTTPAPSGDGTVATIRMYGPIDSWGGYWGISTKDVGEVLDALPDTVTKIVLRVNSPGGEVFEGVSILNMLRAHKATVQAVVDGRAASAASFIVAGCDEAIMSPGTQMMIHAPLVYTYGNASELRKTATVLDSIESSIIEIYEQKAGAKDWPALLADETWLNATETVSMGLANRVAVIPDAGESATVGESEPEELDVPEDLAMSMSVPISTESGLSRNEEVTMSDKFLAGVAERLGITGAEATEEAVITALEDALTAPAAVVSALPEGAVVVDAEAFAELKTAAEEGRKARAEQVAASREAVVAAALADGRIAPASADKWRASLESDLEGTTALIDSLPKNTVPVAEIGNSGGIESADDALYAKYSGKTEEV